MRPTLIASLVLLTLSAPLQAADLLDYYREAQAQDAAYASAKAAYEVAKEKIPQAESANNAPTNSLMIQALTPLLARIYLKVIIPMLMATPCH
jgi:hypothetical protein